MNLTDSARYPLLIWGMAGRRLRRSRGNQTISKASSAVRSDRDVGSEYGKMIGRSLISVIASQGG